MKLTFWGTSHGLPEKDRYCSCTMIDINGRKYLVDAGAPFVNMLIRRDIPLCDLKAIFITHLHGDHTNGLPEFVDLISWYYKDVNTAMLLPEQIGVDALKLWNNAANGNSTRALDFRVYKEGAIYDDGTVKVTAMPTKHGNGNTYAFMLEAENKRVVFTGDIAGYANDMPKVCFERECDAIVGEGAHVSFEEAKDVFERCLTNRIIISHVAPRNECALARLQAEEKSYSLTVAYDGYETEV